MEQAAVQLSSEKLECCFLEDSQVEWATKYLVKY